MPERTRGTTLTFVCRHQLPADALDLGRLINHPEAINLRCQAAGRRDARDGQQQRNKTYYADFSHCCSTSYRANARVRLLFFLQSRGAKDLFCKKVLGAAARKADDPQTIL